MGGQYLGGRVEQSRTEGAPTRHTRQRLPNAPPSNNAKRQPVTSQESFSVPPQPCPTARPGGPADLVILRDLAVSRTNQIVAPVTVSEQKDMLTRGAVGDLGGDHALQKDAGEGPLD